MEKLEQYDGRDLTPIVRLTTMRGATVAEKGLVVRVRAARLILHRLEAEGTQPAEDEGWKIETGPRTIVYVVEK